MAANGLFERETYTAGQQRMIFRNGLEVVDDLQFRASSTFRVLGRHERSVLGVATSNCDPSPTRLRGYEVMLPDHFLFRNLGVQRGQLFGTAGAGASGHE